MNPHLRTVLRSAVMTVNTPIAKRRLTSRLAVTPRPIKLEIGGLEPREGWVVTNVNAVTKHFMDATTRWPLEDDSVEVVYADNVIEHLTLEQGRALFAEAKRCLRPGGAIRLVTPDIRTHVEMYLAGTKPTDSAAGKHYASMNLTVEHPIDLVRIPIGSFGHHAGYVYDFETLAAELTRVGFSNPVHTAPGESTHPDFAGLDKRSHEGGAQLAVEASA